MQASSHTTASFLNETAWSLHGRRNEVALAEANLLRRLRRFPVRPSRCRGLLRRAPCVCERQRLIVVGGDGFLNLELHVAFYGAYHNNPINVFIHALFVWPIFLTALLLLDLTVSFREPSRSSSSSTGPSTSPSTAAPTPSPPSSASSAGASSALTARLDFSLEWKYPSISDLVY
ncbi:hypothetical protein ZWY2020_007295 [Hordeum vulgare]|nr:hypothetical protein ZWY2020_007295 [Hordeum vulgare]